MFNLLSYFHNKYNSRIIQCDETLDYRANFEYALKFTKRLGFNEGSIRDLIDGELDYNNMMEKVCYEAKVDSFSFSAGQCLKWCHFLKPNFESALGCKIWTTVGQLWKGDKWLYNPTYDEFEKWSSKGFQPEDFSKTPALNLHAWYTTDTGHLIDISYLSTLSSVFPDCHEYTGGVLVGKPNDIFPGHQYVPIVVGQDIVEKIQSKSFIPFLANDVEDLMSVGMVIYADPNNE